MRNVKLLVAYDGTAFLGWQKTSMGPSIEESLEKALEQLLQEKISLQAASRTDAGVHAEGQIVNFCTDKDLMPLTKLQKGLNALLPSSIIILNIEEVESHFHPTLDNTGKEYHYFLCNTPYQQPKHRFFSWHVPVPVDILKMQQGTKILLGTHDFSAFCNERSLMDRDPVCTLHSIDIEPLDKERICIKIRGDRFLFRMVRNLVGTLAYVGQEKISLTELENALKSLKRKNAGVTAPAHGLHLIEVFYKKKK